MDSKAFLYSSAVLAGGVFVVLHPLAGPLVVAGMLIAGCSMSGSK
jgi:hypothetical protein